MEGFKGCYTWSAVLEWDWKKVPLDSTHFTDWQGEEEDVKISGKKQGTFLETSVGNHPCVLFSVSCAYDCFIHSLASR